MADTHGTLQTTHTLQVLPELAERLRVCRWPGRQFSYADLLQQADTTAPTHAAQASIIVDIRQPDKQAVIGLTLLAQQTDCPVQLIMVDNASGSPLAPMLLELAHVRLHLHHQASSHAALNLGAIFANTPWLIFLSDKVRPAQDLASQFLRCLTTHNALAARGDIPGTQDVQGPVFNQLNRNMRAHPWAVDLIENMAVHADHFYRLGGFDETLKSGGALDLSLRLYAQQPDTALQRYCPEAKATANLSFDLISFWEQRQQAWAVINERYNSALSDYCYFWLQQALTSKDVSNE